MPRAKNKAKPGPKPKPETKTETNQVGFPMVSPPSRNERSRPKPPATVQVCGNTIRVNNGKAEEADPKKIRARKIAALKKRGMREDEERL